MRGMVIVVVRYGDCAGDLVSYSLLLSAMTVLGTVGSAVPGTVTVPMTMTGCK